jgi:hypothetical protein
MLYLLEGETNEYPPTSTTFLSLGSLHHRTEKCQNL